MGIMYARGTQCISGGNPKWQMSVVASVPRIVVGQLLPSVMVVDKSLVCWSFVWPAEGIEISSLFVAAASCGPAGSPGWKPCEVRASSPGSTQMKAKIERHFCLIFVLFVLQSAMIESQNSRLFTASTVLELTNIRYYM